MRLDWSDLQVFLAAYRTGSLTGAAKVLKVNPTTVGRRLTAFEQQIGAPLLLRKDGVYIVSSPGEAVLGHALQMELHAQLAENQILGAADKLAGRVRLATTSDFSSAFLIHHLKPLREAHPEILIELITTDDLVDIERGEADIAIRFNEAGLPPPMDTSKTEAHIERIGEIGLSVFASEEYLEENGCPERGDHFAGHSLIIPTSESRYKPPQSWLDGNTGRNKVALYTATLSEMTAATDAGLGIAVLPFFMVLRYPRLRQIMPPRTLCSRAIWLLVPGAVRRVQRVRVVQDFLSELFERSLPLLSGHFSPSIIPAR